MITLTNLGSHFLSTFFLQILEAEFQEIAISRPPSWFQPARGGGRPWEGQQCQQQQAS